MPWAPLDACDESITMAMTPSAKAKAAASKAGNGDAKAKTQMHRRSRTGCFTCRLRRKKCDEGSPVCTACRHLGLDCEYKRPMWWSNNEARRQHKEDIKNIIKRKKLAEKTSQPSLSPPPGLSHSLPTSATDPLDRTRSASIDSFNFNVFPSPYEVDVKTERQMFVDDVPTLRESHVATFSTYQTPPGAMAPGVLPPPVHLDAAGCCQPLAEEALDFNFFDFAHGGPSRQVRVELDDADRRLLDHFIQYVLPTIFPILDCNQHGSVASDLVLPALQSNGVYLHCCLSIAAQHLKSQAVVDDDIDQDIMRHRYATIYSLCEALKRDEDHQQILEATLGLIFFQCVVGRLDDDLLDIPWHQHFQAAISLVQKLDLPRLVSSGHLMQTPFNMTLTAWIDILGATMQGNSPTFAHTYREKHLSPLHHHLGLRELMGCEDRVMYLISEIACLESLKRNGMDDFSLCQHVSALGEQMTLTEVGETGPRSPYNANGTLSPKQLSRNMTAAFRLAARIYLCSLVPGFSPGQPSPVGLVEKLATVLRHIPSGPDGFDRSLVWVYLVGGSVSLPGSGFRALFEERVAQLGDQAGCGSFGRMTMVLREVWLQSDSLAQVATPRSSPSDAGQYMHWRDVMRLKGWDYLLI